MAVGQGEAVGGAAFHQRQGLQRFDRRARKHRPGGVAPAVYQIAIYITDGDGAAMQAFHLVASADADQYGIYHHQG